MLPSSFICPRCKCGACYALHRKGLDWAMSFVGLRPAKCLTCSKKFFARYQVSGGGRKRPLGRKEPITIQKRSHRDRSAEAA